MLVTLFPGSEPWLNPGGYGWSIILAYLPPELCAMLSLGIFNGMQLAPMPTSSDHRNTHQILSYCYDEQRVHDFAWTMTRELQIACENYMDKEKLLLDWLRRCCKVCCSTPSIWLQKGSMETAELWTVVIGHLGTLWRSRSGVSHQRRMNVFLRQHQHNLPLCVALLKYK